VTAAAGPDATRLSEAFRHCAAIARESARDQWLGALFAPARSRDGLLALACFDHEIRQAKFRARDANLAAIRLAWWREAALGARDAGGSPAALAFGATIDAFALPPEAIEAMLDARLTEIAPPLPFTLSEFERYAGESEGARLRLAARIASGGPDLDAARAHEPAGAALALVGMLAALPARAGAAPTLFPVDVVERHGGAAGDLDGRRGAEAVVAAVADLIALARDRLLEAERRLKASPAAILPAFVPLGALRLDLDRLALNATRPFEPFVAASALRRQWAIWRWTRRF